jgi:RTX calcium-binding nonapeptide repeat (4 copies)
MKRRKFTVVAVLVGGAVAASTAGAASVENGGFETDSLTGWTQVNSLAGEWETYSEGDLAFAAPPEGNFAAVATQDEESYQVLYQDLKLKRGRIHQLSFKTYYANNAAGFITPDNLSVTANPNQQYTADVLRKDADPRSLRKDDVLASLFRTEVGDPQEADPTEVKTDLSPFGGATVRLRFGVATTQNQLLAGLDDVRVKSKKAPKCAGNRPTIVGTEGKDKLKGTRKDDVILARGGKDRVKGKGGDDLLCGNGAKDKLIGGGGEDECSPGPAGAKLRSCEE